MAKQNPAKLRKIAVDQLTLGMFLNEFCGSWMDHPFWQTRFLLENPADIASIRASAVKEVWIDTSRGLDLPEACQMPPAESAEETSERMERELMETIAVRSSPVARVDFASEVRRAAALCNQARGAVTEMFSEARMGKSVNQEELAPLVEEINASVMRNPGALISLARLKSKDDYTYMHSVAVCGLMISLARQLGLDADSVHEAGLAGLIHDLGKALVSQDILNKPGKLTDEEFRHIQNHPKLGFDLLVEGNAVGDIALDVCLHHHEKVDGSGYPDKLNEHNLSLFAKMGAVCDVYDAITSDRPYKAGWDPAFALRKMNEWCAGHFEPKVFQAFVKTVGIYPVGSLIKLKSGLLGVVTEISNESLLTPQVTTFFCTRRRAPMPVKVVDLASKGKEDGIVGLEPAEKWGFGSNLIELWTGITWPPPAAPQAAPAKPAAAAPPRKAQAVR